MNESFNGTYTIQNIVTGESRTFKIHTQPQDSKFAPGERVVSMLTGPNNEHDYQGWGFLKTNGIRIWRSKQTAAYEHYANILCLAIKSLVGDDEDLVGTVKYHDRVYRVLLSKICRVCNRKLTTPESIKAGVGPICARGGRD